MAQCQKSGSRAEKLFFLKKMFSKMIDITFTHKIKNGEKEKKEVM